MPVQVFATIPLTNFLAYGWRIKGHTQGLGYQFTNPASPSETNYGGWWAPNVNGKPWIAGHVLSFWVDFNPPIGKQYSFPPWVRETLAELVLNEAALNALLGISVAVGQDIGFRARSLLGLSGSYGSPPQPFLEVEADGQIERFTPTGSFDLYTLPPGGAPTVQDSYLTVPLGASKSVTLRFGVGNVAPSMNLSWMLDEFEVAAFLVAGAPEPEPEVPPPSIPLDCSTSDILYKAESETGYRWDSHTEPANALYRYAKQLLSRCMASWSGNEDEESAVTTIDLSALPVAGGFGFNFGFDFGGLGGIVPGFIQEFDLPSLEAIWLVEARRTVGGTYDRVHVVKPGDQSGAVDPRVLIGDRVIRLLGWNTVWQGTYDQLRLRATAVHGAPSDYSISLAPNIHIGPLFCRACELYMSRRLALIRQDKLQAMYLASELYDVTKDLMGQSRSQRWVETALYLRR